MMVYVCIIETMATQWVLAFEWAGSYTAKNALVS